MPLLTETTHPRMRRVPVWLLMLTMVVLPLVGVVGWSCYQPLTLAYELKGIAFGRVPADHLSHWQRVSGYAWQDGPAYGGRAVKLPGGEKTSWYWIGWGWE
jgi:hypothetical protein